jgi:hypothetical protein
VATLAIQKLRKAHATEAARVPAFLVVGGTELPDSLKPSDIISTVLPTTHANLMFEDCIFLKSQRTSY